MTTSSPTSMRVLDNLSLDFEKMLLSVSDTKEKSETRRRAEVNLKDIITRALAVDSPLNVQAKDQWIMYQKVMREREEKFEQQQQLHQQFVLQQQAEQKRLKALQEEGEEVERQRKKQAEDAGGVPTTTSVEANAAENGKDPSPSTTDATSSPEVTSTEKANEEVAATQPLQPATVAVESHGSTTATVPVSDPTFTQDTSSTTTTPSFTASPRPNGATTNATTTPAAGQTTILPSSPVSGLVPPGVISLPVIPSVMRPITMMLKVIQTTLLNSTKDRKRLGFIALRPIAQLRHNNNGLPPTSISRSTDATINTAAFVPTRIGSPPTQQQGGGRVPGGGVPSLSSSISTAGTLHGAVLPWFAPGMTHIEAIQMLDMISGALADNSIGDEIRSVALEPLKDLMTTFPSLTFTHLDALLLPLIALVPQHVELNWSGGASGGGGSGAGSGGGGAASAAITSRDLATQEPSGSGSPKQVLAAGLVELTRCVMDALHQTFRSPPGTVLSKSNVASGASLMTSPVPVGSSAFPAGAAATTLAVASGASMQQTTDHHPTSQQQQPDTTSIYGPTFDMNQIVRVAHAGFAIEHLHNSKAVEFTWKYCISYLSEKDVDLWSILHLILKPMLILMRASFSKPDVREVVKTALQEIRVRVAKQLGSGVQAYPMPGGIVMPQPSMVPPSALITTNGSSTRVGVNREQCLKTVVDVLRESQSADSDTQREYLQLILLFLQQAPELAQRELQPLLPRTARAVIPLCGEEFGSTISQMVAAVFASLSPLESNANANNNNNNNNNSSERTPSATPLAATSLGSVAIVSTSSAPHPDDAAEVVTVNRTTPAPYFVPPSVIVEHDTNLTELLWLIAEEIQQDTRYRSQIIDWAVLIYQKYPAQFDKQEQRWLQSIAVACLARDDAIIEKAVAALAVVAGRNHVPTAPPSVPLRGETPPMVLPHEDITHVASVPYTTTRPSSPAGSARGGGGGGGAAAATPGKSMARWARAMDAIVLHMSQSASRSSSLLKAELARVPKAIEQLLHQAAGAGFGDDTIMVLLATSLMKEPFCCAGVAAAQEIASFGTDVGGVALNTTMPRTFSNSVMMNHEHLATSVEDLALRASRPMTPNPNRSGGGGGGIGGRSTGSEHAAETRAVHRSFVKLLIMNLTLILLSFPRMKPVCVLLRKSCKSIGAAGGSSAGDPGSLAGVSTSGVHISTPVNSCVSLQWALPHPGTNGGDTTTTTMAANGSTFRTLYRCWSCNPPWAIGLCLLSRSYKHAYEIVCFLGQKFLSAAVLCQLDRLASLIESPALAFARMDVLEPHRDENVYLVKTLYAILMLLPQSAESYEGLSKRLQVAVNHHLHTNSVGALQAHQTAASLGSAAAVGEGDEGGNNNSVASQYFTTMFLPAQEGDNEDMTMV